MNTISTEPTGLVPPERRGPLGVALDRAADLGSGVSWAAVFAGAAGAAALSLALMVLGVGLGLSSVSPYSGIGAGAAAVGASAIAWLLFTHLAASGMGGYLAGRLRTRWLHTPTDEVYFRDTAHGFLAWAVATLLAAGLLGSTIGSIVSGAADVGGGAATVAAAAAGADARGNLLEGGAGRNDYYVDSMFRMADAGPMAPSTSVLSTEPAPNVSRGNVNGADNSGEARRILAAAMADGSMPAADAQYLSRLVAQRTGLSQADAEKRVNETFAQAQEKASAYEEAARDAADATRKAAAYVSLWLFVALLVGAFVASLAATYGGRRRDY